MAATEPFADKKLARTTGWNNNCSFNCLAHFLAGELEGASAESLKKIISYPGYQQLLKTFSDYYGIKPEISAESLKKLLAQYSNPVDKEVILGPVLRQVLVQELYKNLNNPQKRSDISDEFRQDLEMYFRKKQNTPTGAIDIHYNDLNQFYLFKSNFPKVVELYNKFDIASKADPTLTIEKFLDNDKAKNILETQGGFEIYAAYMAENSTLISVQELDLLTKQMGIGIQIYVDRGDHVALDADYQGAVNPDRNLRIYHRGNHWEYEAATEAIAASHNASYANLDAIKAAFQGSIDEKVRADAKTKAPNLTPKLLEAHLPNVSVKDTTKMIQENIQKTAELLGIMPQSKAEATSQDSEVQTEKAPKAVKQKKSVRFSDENESTTVDRVDLAAEEDIAHGAKKVSPDRVPKKSSLKSSAVETSPTITVTPSISETLDLRPVDKRPEAEVKARAEKDPELTSYTKPPFQGMYTTHTERAIKELQTPADFELRAKSVSPEKLITSFQWLDSQIKEGNEKRGLDNPHPFEDVALAPGSTKEKMTLLIKRSDSDKYDSITRTLDSDNNISAQLSGDSEDKAFVVMALSNTHFAPMTLQKHKDPNKVLKVMEAFLHAGVPIDIGDNKQLFEAPDCPSKLKTLYMLLSEKDGEDFKIEISKLTQQERDKRKFGEPLELDTLTASVSREVTSSFKPEI